MRTELDDGVNSLAQVRFLFIYVSLIVFFTDMTLCVPFLFLMELFSDC